MNLDSTWHLWLLTFYQWNFPVLVLSLLNWGTVHSINLLYASYFFRINLLSSCILYYLSVHNWILFLILAEHKQQQQQLQCIAPFCCSHIRYKQTHLLSGVPCLLHKLSLAENSLTKTSHRSPDLLDHYSILSSPRLLDITYTFIYKSE